MIVFISIKPRNLKCKMLISGRYPGDTYRNSELLKPEYKCRGGSLADFPGLFSVKAYTGKLRPKGVPFSGFRFIKR